MVVEEILERGVHSLSECSILTTDVGIGNQEGAIGFAPYQSQDRPIRIHRTACR
jgi:hypothetical protein